MNKHLLPIIPLLTLLFLMTCSDSGSDNNTFDCSVSARCLNQSDLAVRLRQVETLFYEQESDNSTSFIDLAQFDYNDEDQWTGGVTRRVSGSDFDYSIEYGPDGKMSRSTREFFADSGGTAQVIIDYFYDGEGQLDRSEAATEVLDEDGNFFKNIDEVIDYTFVDGLLDNISFDVVDTDLGNSQFSYEFTYQTGQIKDILVTNQQPGDLDDYTFKSFVYDEEGRISSSVTNDKDEVEQERVSYEYYEDGPIKKKTALVVNSATEKVETVYSWESGDCASNQTFGDRLFPTPEVINFPCY